MIKTNRSLGNFSEYQFKGISKMINKLDKNDCIIMGFNIGFIVCLILWEFIK